MKKNLIHFQKALKTTKNKKILYAPDLARCATMFFDMIQEGLVMGDDVNFKGLGKFVTKKRKSHEMYDTLRGRKITTSPKKNVHFVCSNAMKKKINASEK